MLEDIPQIRSGVQLSVVQGYMAKKFRLYGKWVARNPVLVLFSSLVVLLLLGLGLIRFQVETRPEKLWVGHGSRAAEEKQYFDSHLAPFYRIEQYFKMDPKNYDDFGGVDHAEYCFQVYKNTGDISIVIVHTNG